MEERRKQKRVPAEFEALFLQDGIITQLKVCDAHDGGVGAYISRELKPGQQGMLLAKTSPNKTEELPSEVCWCIQDPMSEDAVYPYRLGLKLLADSSLNT